MKLLPLAISELVAHAEQEAVGFEGEAAKGARPAPVDLECEPRVASGANLAPKRLVELSRARKLRLAFADAAHILGAVLDLVDPFEEGDGVPCDLLDRLPLDLTRDTGQVVAPKELAPVHKGKHVPLRPAREALAHQLLLLLELFHRERRRHPLHLALIERPRVGHVAPLEMSLPVLIVLPLLLAEHLEPCEVEELEVRKLHLPGWLGCATRVDRLAVIQGIAVVGVLVVVGLGHPFGQREHPRVLALAFRLFRLVVLPFVLVQRLLLAAKREVGERVPARLEPLRICA